MKQTTHPYVVPQNDQSTKGGVVSVIIPSFKMGQFIGEALESVGSQTYQHWEVIVVDDAGPEDGTRAAVEAFAAKHPDHRVEYIRQETNQGVSVARRTAFDVSCGEYIAFLDADDAFLPEKLALQVDGLQAHPECVLVHGPAVLEGAEASRLLSGWNTASRGGKPRVYRLLDENGFLFRNLICNSTVLCRSGFLRRGYFTDNLVYQFEDWLLWLRLAGAGPFLYRPEQTARYRIHAESFSGRQLKDSRTGTFAHLEMLASYFPHARACCLRTRVASAMVDILGNLVASKSSGAPKAVMPLGLRVRLSILLGVLWSTVSLAVGKRRKSGSEADRRSNG